jgi:hypothetical protein
MNGVERILHYANSIEQEAPHEMRDAKVVEDWPVRIGLYVPYRPN